VAPHSLFNFCLFSPPPTSKAGASFLWKLPQLFYFS
jgi:hypothetical protein